MKTLAVVAIWGALLTPAQAESDNCTPPAPVIDMKNDAHYDFVMTYKPECASKRNWDRTFDDVIVSTDQMSVTASTALAGAIASVRHRGKEYIGSGGHGSAFQWSIRSTPRATWPFTECYNPTQAGSQRDDGRDQKPPYHGPSTSALTEFDRTSAASFRAGSRLAMYVPRPEKSKFDGCDSRDHQPERSPFTLGLSPYLLDTDVTLNGNVIHLGAALNVEEDPGHQMSSTIVAYLQRDFTEQYSYRGNGVVEPFDPKDLTNRPFPVMRCTLNGQHCMGMYFQPSKYQGKAYYYAESVAPDAYTAWGGAYTMEVTTITRDRERHVDLEAYAAVGTREIVMQTLDRLSRELP